MEFMSEISSPTFFDSLRKLDRLYLENSNLRPLSEPEACCEKTKFSEQQIAFILLQAEEFTSPAGPRLGTSSAT